MVGSEKNTSSDHGVFGDCPPNSESAIAVNVEIKARLASLQAAERIAQELATDRLPDQHQIDTYFACRSGRLKLREIMGLSSELIWYERPDQLAAKQSHYVIAPVPQAAFVKQALAQSLGVLTVVEKRRQIHLFHSVRIHLDEVRDLGLFLEFEAVLDNGNATAEGQQLVRQLLQRFQIADEDLCPNSYSDMLLSAAESQSNTSSNTSSDT